MLSYHQLYIYFLYKLLVIYKYLDEYFKKSFIKTSKSSTTVLILLACKFKEDIHVYIDYRSLNNVIIKNRYLIPLMYKTFDILYHAKIYIKLNIITVFNRLYIAFRNE